MLLLIDNYDSFTYNLFQYLCALGEEVRVMLTDRNEFTEKLVKEKVVLFGLEFYFRELVRSMERLK